MGYVNPAQLSNWQDANPKTIECLFLVLVLPSFFFAALEKGETVRSLFGFDARV